MKIWQFENGDNPTSTTFIFKCSNLQIDFSRSDF